MSPFLKAAESRALAMREEKLLTLRGSEIPGETRGNAGRSANEELRDSILRTTRQHPDWTPNVIAEELQCAAITVRKIQRQAGVYRAAVRGPGGFGAMPMPPAAVRIKGTLRCIAMPDAYDADGPENEGDR